MLDATHFLSFFPLDRVKHRPRDRPLFPDVREDNDKTQPSPSHPSPRSRSQHLADKAHFIEAIKDGEQRPISAIANTELPKSNILRPIPLSLSDHQIFLFFSPISAVHLALVRGPWDLPPTNRIVNIAATAISLILVNRQMHNAYFLMLDVPNGCGVFSIANYEDSGWKLMYCSVTN